MFVVVVVFNNQEDLSVLVGNKEEKIRKREIKKVWEKWRMPGSGKDFRRLRIWIDQWSSTRGTSLSSKAGERRYHNMKRELSIDRGIEASTEGILMSQSMLVLWRVSPENSEVAARDVREWWRFGVPSWSMAERNNQAYIKAFMA